MVLHNPIHTKLFDDAKPVTSDLGTDYGGTNTLRPSHAGVDFGSVGFNTKYKAIKSGQVWYNTNSTAGLGIRLRTNDGEDVYYSHSSDRLVANGQKVNEGDYLGITGDSGHADGPHLHIEVRKNGKVLYTWDYILYDDMVTLKTTGEGQVKIGADIKDASGNIIGRVKAENLRPVEGRDDVGKTWLYTIQTNPKDKTNMYGISEGGGNFVSFPDFIGADTECGKSGVYLTSNSPCDSLVKQLQTFNDSKTAENEYLKNDINSKLDNILEKVNEA